jgi:UDP-N-acetylglucosamine--N-acetylmuramyl-(pentapeptide) pyrophosphoryl-undecaprenol N-acetylglucosamine transferase
LVARVLVAAGGTGGHVYPALAVAEVLRARGHDVSFVGGRRMEVRLVADSGFTLHSLPARGLPRAPTPSSIGAGFALARSVPMARRLIADLGIDLVLAMGGYPSVAPAWAAALMRRGIVVHERGAHIGLGNRLALRWAKVLALSLPLERPFEGRRPRVVLTGNPLRERIRALAEANAEARHSLRVRAQERWGLDTARLTLLCVGGSLGAARLNEAVPLALDRWDGPAVQVLHIAGATKSESVRAPKEIPYVVEEYVDEMELAYAAADLVVCRAGASTISDVTALGLPSILVPAPQVPGDEQLANARVLERAGAARVVEQSAHLVEALRTAIAASLSDPSARDGLAGAARSLGKPDAADRLADVVESVVSETS